MAQLSSGSRPLGTAVSLLFACLLWSTAGATTPYELSKAPRVRASADHRDRVRGIHIISFHSGGSLQVEVSGGEGVEPKHENKVLAEVARTLGLFSPWIALPTRMGLIVPKISDNAQVSLLRDDDEYVSFLSMPYEMLIRDDARTTVARMSARQWRTVLIHEVGHILYRQEIARWETELGKSFPHGQKPMRHPHIQNLLTEMFADLFAAVALGDPKAVAESLSVEGQNRPPHALLRDFSIGEVEPNKWGSFFKRFGGLEGEFMKDRHLALSPVRHLIWQHLFEPERDFIRQMAVMRALFRTVVKNKIEWESYPGELTTKKLNELIWNAIEHSEEFR